MRSKKNGQNRVYCWWFQMEFRFIFISIVTINRTLNETIKILCECVISTWVQSVERRLCCHFDFTWITQYRYMHFSRSRTFSLSISLSRLLLSFSCRLLSRYQPKFNIIVAIAMKSFAMLCNSSFVFTSSFYALCNGYSSKSISYLSIFHIRECFYLKIYWQFVIIVIQPLSSAMQRIAWIIN